MARSLHRMARQIYEVVSWTLPTILMIAVGILFVRRGLARRFPFFMTYLASNILQAAVGWYAVRVYGAGSLRSFLLYSASEAVVLICRGLFIAELCYNYLREYRGIWGLAWRLLALVAAGLGVVAALAATPRTYWIGGFVLSLQGGLEIVSAATLLLLLAIAGYYGIEVPRIGRLMAMGFVAYSACVLIYDIVIIEWYKFARYLSALQELSFLIFFSVLTVALWRPLPVETRAPVLLPANIYLETVPELNYRLQILNDRLLEFLRS